ncbi:hypothetical protein GF362_04100 [Candidatus Dojkabacteria bacterium]|nr:hypothetical protein [Candidatus Dojkabacteria bacterium]
MNILDLPENKAILLIHNLESSSFKNQESLKHCYRFFLEFLSKGKFDIHKDNIFKIGEIRKKYSDGNQGFETILVNNNKAFIKRGDQLILTKAKRVPETRRTFGKLSYEIVVSNINNEHETFPELIPFEKYIIPIYINYAKLIELTFEKIYNIKSKHLQSEKNSHTEIELGYLNQLLQPYEISRANEIAEVFHFTKLKQYEDLNRCYYFIYNQSNRLISEVKKIVSEYDKAPNLLNAKSATYKKIKYEGVNVWDSEDGFSCAPDNTAKISEKNILLFERTRDLLVWEYCNHIAKNKKTCDNCGHFLKKDYRGKYCPKEDNPNCYKQREVLRKRKSRKNK